MTVKKKDTLNSDSNKINGDIHLLEPRKIHKILEFNYRIRNKSQSNSQKINPP